MIETAGNTDFDFGSIRITPNVQDRINEMRRRQAEERADRSSRIAMEARRDKMHAQAEAERYRLANANLLCQLHAAMGWPRRAMLPAPGEM